MPRSCSLAYVRFKPPIEMLSRLVSNHGAACFDALGTTNRGSSVWPFWNGSRLSVSLLCPTSPAMPGRTAPTGSTQEVGPSTLQALIAWLPCRQSPLHASLLQLQGSAEATSTPAAKRGHAPEVLGDSQSEDGIAGRFHEGAHALVLRAQLIAGDHEHGSPNRRTHERVEQKRQQRHGSDAGRHRD